jgi:uncharacterized damage-inducible protein DinB
MMRRKERGRRTLTTTLSTIAASHVRHDWTRPAGACTPLTFVFYSPRIPDLGDTTTFRHFSGAEGPMDQKALFMKFWDKEAAATRKVIERIPQDRSDYRADPKARTARDIAWLLVREEVVLGEGLEKGAINWEDVPTPATVKEILDAYDTHHPDVTRKLHQLSAATWEQSVPGYDSAWGFLLDLIHHRGQLSTYLRPMGSTVPAIYGPSADEGM